MNKFWQVLETIKAVYREDTMVDINQGLSDEEYEAAQNLLQKYIHLYARGRTWSAGGGHASVLCSDED